MVGDLRIIKLANMLAKDGNIIYTYGLEKAKELKENSTIKFCSTLEEIVDKDIDIAIGPIPFSSDGKSINMPFSNQKLQVKELLDKLNKKTLIAGSISTQVCEIAKDKNIDIIDIMKREELAVLNTIATAEGTIQIAIENTEKIIHGSEILILGFGRVGKILAKKMEALSAKVTCAVRRKEDIAWAKAYGYNQININTIGENLSKYDIIINTVPDLILNKERLKYVKKECLLIDLASNPGGIDREETKQKNLKFIWALALPGKVAPITTAQFLKDTIYNILKEKQI